MGRRGAAWVFACLLFMLMLSGCQPLPLETDLLLRPPLADAEQQAVADALKAFLGTDSYVLKYPKTGETMSAFLWQDVDGDGTDEAVCFYCLDNPEEKTHVNLLRKTEDGWQSVSDAAGQGTEVEWVAFGDLQGDGRKELFTGWNLYSSNRDRQLVLYALDKDTLTACYTATYSAAAVGDITAQERDTLLLFAVDGIRQKVTASLMAWENGSVTQLGQTELDGAIQSFGAAQVCRLTEDVGGVLIDAYKDNDQTITELVCWEDGQLTAPFYDADKGLTERTAREALPDSRITCADMNGDGIPEWPRTRRLAGYEDTELKNALFLTTWYRWDHAHRMAQPLFDCIVNEADGYYVRLDPDWVGGTAAGDTVTATYTAAAHCFALVSAADPRQVLLSLTPQTLDGGEKVEGMASFSMVQSDDSRYTVRYTTAPEWGLSQERIRYLVTVLP